MFIVKPEQDRYTIVFESQQDTDFEHKLLRHPKVYEISIYGLEWTINFYEAILPEQVKEIVKDCLNNSLSQYVSGFLED